jgi:ankyrin repeat protein
MTTSPPSRSETTERFFDAIERADEARLRAMVAEGFDIAAAEAERGEGALEYAVFFHANIDPRPVLRLLLELGADVNACIDGTTALWLAVIQSDVEVAE